MISSSPVIFLSQILTSTPCHQTYIYAFLLELATGYIVTRCFHNANLFLVLLRDYTKIIYFGHIYLFKMFVYFDHIIIVIFS